MKHLSSVIFIVFALFLVSGPASAIAAADLTVANIECDGGVLSIKIANVGDADVEADASGSFNIWINDNLEWTYDWSTWTCQDFRTAGGACLVQPQLLEGENKVKACVLPSVEDGNTDNDCLEVVLDCSQSSGCGFDLKPGITGPSTAVSGDTLQSLVSATLTNNGDSKAELVSVGFYISEDSDITTDDTLLLGGREHVTVGPGDVVDVVINGTLTLPDLTPGMYYLGILADEFDSFAECDETNNQASLPIEILAAPCKLPDLKTTISGPETAAVGDAIATLVSATVANAGGSDAENVTVGFYLSNDEIITPDDFLLIGGRENINVPAGDVIDVVINGTLTIPELVPGTYYLGILPDEFNAIEECDENNNQSVVKVEITGAPCNLPDLTPEIKGPESAIVGESIAELVKSNVQNIGTGNAENVSIGFYLSEDEVISTDDVLLIGGRENISVAGGDIFDVVFNGSLTIPDVPPGTYYLGILVDEFNGMEECDEDNNQAAVKIEILSKGCELTELSTRIDGPESAMAGDSLKDLIKASLINSGASGAKNVSIGFYISPDRQITTGDKLLVGGREHLDILDGESLDIPINGELTIPDIAPGSYFIGVLADEYNEIEECNENNNASIFSIEILDGSCEKADYAASLTGDHVVTAGKMLRDAFQARVFNAGTDWQKSFMVEFLLSKDEIPDENDQFLFVEEIKNLKPGKSTQIRFDRTSVIPDVKKGDYYLIMIIDRNGSVDECDESNNKVVFSVSVKAKDDYYDDGGDIVEPGEGDNLPGEDTGCTTCASIDDVLNIKLPAVDVMGFKFSVELVRVMDGNPFVLKWTVGDVNLAGSCAYAEGAPNATLDEFSNLTIPCLEVNGLNIGVFLRKLPDETQMVWEFDHVIQEPVIQEPEEDMVR